MARCITPKRCCSSVITKPKLLYLTSSLIKACVPIAISISPSSKPLYIFFFFATDFDFFIEVFGFIFSFALWEGFDAMIYSLSEIKEEREAITQNLLMEIEFNDINIKD